MKFLVAALVLFVSNASAYYEDPHEVFGMTKNMTNQTAITFIQADNIRKTCDAESKKRGLPPFGFDVDACSFMDKTSCTIVTGKTTNFHTIGHEVRHCLQGSWHK